MRSGCRDCPRCTESAIVSLVSLPFRVIGSLLTFWNIGLFRKRCPQCGHLMTIHQRIGGRFVD